MGTLFGTFIMALIQLLMFRQNYVEKAYETYCTNLRRNSRKMLEDALTNLAKKTVEKKTSSVSVEESEDMLTHNKHFIDTVHLFKQEQDMILRSRNNFKPQKMNFREKLHYFSIYMDESLDVKIVNL